MVADIPLDIKVAVMGCVVNGPGEAKEADIGIAGGMVMKDFDQKRRDCQKSTGGSALKRHWDELLLTGMRKW